MTTPPQGHSPYGQNPYGQQPYGQAPYPQAPQPPQAPYGQQPQPGFPQAPQQPYMQGGAPTPPQPTRSSRSPKTVLKGIVAVVALIVIGVAWVSSWNDADTAEVGNCMKNEGNEIKPDLKVVDCGTAEAKFKVTAVHANTTDMELCPKNTTAYAESQRHRRSTTRFVLCLEPLK
ncbi:hypothetical protein ACFXO2_08450 [Streptomyces sp. NPDC059152]|uniref:LppU/SCO3897 family protein n=1 Tax=Streptomyces sp. NPDC059152 TaxID=3346742 RepID=UPI0036B08796